jgi:RNA polymerase sigma-70 factor (ECF subfamily)
MPPYTLWLQGPDAIRHWLLGRGSGCRGSTLIRTAACGSPAFAQYRRSAEGGYHAWSLTVLELEGARIKAWNAFLDTERLFPLFGLPITIEAQGLRPKA